MNNEDRKLTEIETDPEILEAIEVETKAEAEIDAQFAFLADRDAEMNFLRAENPRMAVDEIVAHLRGNRASGLGPEELAKGRAESKQQALPTVPLRKRDRDIDLDWD